MKRTLAISLWFALGAAAVAQNPAVVQKNVQTAVSKASQSSSATSAPVSVKVVPVPAKTQAATVKPVVVAAKPAPSQVKPVVVSAKPVAVPPVQVKTPVQAKPVAVTSKPVAVQATHVAVAVPASAPKVASTAKTDLGKPGKPQVAVKSAPVANAANAKTEDKTPETAPKEQSVAQNGRRDPFISPIVTMTAVGSGCSSGKRCLAIDQINLKGIVKSETGMIAVVVNAAEKAYFLRENDPVFNGYVVKITGDSIVFKETFQDKLGKPLTRDVTKTISRPVA